MRCTFGTVACLTAAILFTTAFWPGDHAGPMPRPAIAQETIDAKTTVKFPAPGVLMDPIDAESRKLVESKLAGHQAEFKFADKRLKEALEAIGDAVQVDIVLDEESLKNCGVDPDLTVTFGLKYAKMSAATQLRMMLAKYKLGYFIKDGLVVVDTLGNAENHTDVRIYNCRDLLHKFRRKAERVLAVRSSDAEAEVEAVKKSIWFSTPENADPDQIAAQELIEVLCAYSGGNWEITSGDGGYITEYNGLLIAQNTQDALRSLERTLEVLREIDEQTLPEAISISDPPADKKQ